MYLSEVRLYQARIGECILLPYEQARYTNWQIRAFCPFFSLLPIGSIYLARIRLLAVGISSHVWLEKCFFKNLSFVVVQILRIKTQLRSPGRLPAAEGSEGGLGRGTRLRGAIKKTTTDVGFLAQVSKAGK